MNIFQRHPCSVGQSYSEHFGFASLMGIEMVFGGIWCLIHAVFPFLFENTASDIVTQINERCKKRKEIIAKSLSQTP